MTRQPFSTYVNFSEAAYRTNNASNGQSVEGWQPVKVEHFQATNPNFAAQLYTDGQCNYRIAIDWYSNPPPMPQDWGMSFDPIGAFHDSQSKGYDQSTSIAAYTPVVLDALSKRPLSKAELAARDSNGDGTLSLAEGANLLLWRDLNEQGSIDAGELAGFTQALRREDWSLYTQGNGRTSAQPVASMLPAVPLSISAPAQPVKPVLDTSTPFSNYRALHDTEAYFALSNGTIFWSADQVKLSYKAGLALYQIGTDGNDSFDINYYAGTILAPYLGNVKYFLAGDGNDAMGGSDRSDVLWGGTGDDFLLGYAGDDRIYGEEGDGADNDLLIGGADNDILFGGTGDDELNGGDGTLNLEESANLLLRRGLNPSDISTIVSGLRTSPRFPFAS